MIDRRTLAAVLAILLSGCDVDPAADVAAPAAVTIQAVPQAGGAKPAPESAPQAAPTPKNRPPLTEMAPQKPFIDPPLPPELLDDDDLIPLPSPTQPR